MHQIVPMLIEVPTKMKLFFKKVLQLSSDGNLNLSYHLIHMMVNMLPLNPNKNVTLTCYSLFHIINRSNFFRYITFTRCLDKHHLSRKSKLTFNLQELLGDIRAGGDKVGHVWRSGGRGLSRRRLPWRRGLRPFSRRRQLSGLFRSGMGWPYSSAAFVSYLPRSSPRGAGHWRSRSSGRAAPAAISAGGKFLGVCSLPSAPLRTGALSRFSDLWGWFFVCSGGPAGIRCLQICHR
jgi:hypothetical protein